MSKESITQEFRLKEIDEVKNYIIEEIKQNELIIEKHLSYFSFHSYWMCLHFCFWFFNWYSCRYCKLCSRNKNLCNNCNN